MVRFWCILTLFLFFSSATSAEAPKSTHRQKQVVSGNTFYSLLKKHKFNEQQVRKILRDPARSKHWTLAPGDLYRVTKTPSENFVELTFYDRHRDRGYVFWRKGKDQSGFEDRKLKLRTEVIDVDGRVKGSLIGSIRKAVGNIHVAYRFMDAYVYQPHIHRKLARGAKFSLSVEKKYHGRDFVRFGEILKTSLEVRGKNLRRKFVMAGTGGAFIDVNEKQKSKLLFAPVNNVRVTSHFQKRRKHPIKKVRRPHLGTDFELPTGDPIYAPRGGHVVKMGRNRAAGRYIVLKHNNNIKTYYNHLSRQAKGLKKGDWVRSGQLIGYIGCSGYCTKPHLHFAVKKNNRFVDPMKYTKTYSFGLRKTVESQFR